MSSAPLSPITRSLGLAYARASLGRGLEICVPVDESSAGIFPAQQIRIANDEDIKELRDLCDERLKARAKYVKDYPF